MQVRAAIYARISSDKAGEGLGVDRQRIDCEALAASKGWSVATVLIDNDVSASGSKPRAAYGELLDGIRNGTFDAVCVWKPDRLYRKPTDLEEFIVLVEEHGTKLATIEGDYNLATPQGRAMARVGVAMAKAEVENTSDRVRRAFDQMAAEGKWKPTGYRPFGYIQEGNTLAIHEVEAAMIREAATRTLAGESRSSVVRDFHARGLRTSTGKPWSLTRMAEVLRSPTITGLRIHRGEVIGEGNWEPILERKSWERVGKKLRRSGTAPHGRRRQLLTGVIRCSRCGQKLSAKRRTDHQRLYKCASDSAASCGGLSVVAEPVERMVLATAWEHCDRPDMQPELVTGDPRRTAIQERLWELGEVQAELAEHRRTGILNAKVFTDELRILRGERDRLEAELSKLGDGSKRMLVASEVQLIAQEGVPEDLNGLEPDAVEFWRSVVAEVFESVFVKPASVRGRKRFDPMRVILVPNEGYEGAHMPDGIWWETVETA